MVATLTQRFSLVILSPNDSNNTYKQVLYCIYLTSYCKFLSPKINSFIKRKRKFEQHEHQVRNYWLCGQVEDLFVGGSGSSNAYVVIASRHRGIAKLNRPCSCWNTMRTAYPQSPMCPPFPVAGAIIIIIVIIIYLRTSSTDKQQVRSNNSGRTTRQRTALTVALKHGAK